jgi:hypothetical protein
MPLGIVDGRVTKASMTASSMYSTSYGPWLARLQSTQYWLSKYNNKNQYLQIDLRTLSRMSKIATQGRPNAYQWVTTYSLSYSTNRVRFNAYTEYKRTKVWFMDFLLR